jgi:hypothetical protein
MLTSFFIENGRQNLTFALKGLRSSNFSLGSGWSAVIKPEESKVTTILTFYHPARVLLRHSRDADDFPPNECRKSDRRRCARHYLHRRGNRNDPVGGPAEAPEQ